MKNIGSKLGKEVKKRVESERIVDAILVGLFSLISGVLIWLIILGMLGVIL